MNFTLVGASLEIIISSLHMSYKNSEKKLNRFLLTLNKLKYFQDYLPASSILQNLITSKILSAKAAAIPLPPKFKQLRKLCQCNIQVKAEERRRGSNVVIIKFPRPPPPRTLGRARGKAHAPNIERSTLDDGPSYYLTLKSCDMFIFRL